MSFPRLLIDYDSASDVPKPSGQNQQSSAASYFNIGDPTSGDNNFCAPNTQPKPQTAFDNQQTLRNSDSDLSNIVFETSRLSSSYIPALDKEDPEIFFTLLEIGFDDCNIQSEEKKWRCLVKHLPRDIVILVRDQILYQPPVQPYHVLKRRILEVLQEPKSIRLNKLLDEETLGDRKPSFLLARIRERASSFNLDSSFIAELWMRKLPHQTRMCLETASNLDIDALARLADNVTALQPSPGLSIQAVSDPCSTEETPSHDLHKRITELEDQLRVFSVNSTFTTYRPSNRGGNNNRRGRNDRGTNRTAVYWDRTHPINNRPTFSNSSERHPTSPAPATFSSAASTTGLCFYHNKHGVNANRCRQPCNYFSQSGN